MTRDFRRLDDPAAFFFRPPDAPGRSPVLPLPDVRQRVLELRKANLSVPDIKARLDAEPGDAPSLRAIGHVLHEEGFQRLPRRTRAERAAATTPRLRAPASVLLDPHSEQTFQSERAAGLLCLLPWIRRYGLDTAIAEAGYPGTRALPALQSVLAFVALKLSDARRYSADDLCCMDRGLGLFAGLNVLPKTASLSSYSDRTTRAMNQRLLGSLAAIWTAKGLAGDSANLDFTTLPHWGADATLQKHGAGTRGRSLVSISAALAQDPDSGLLLQADASSIRTATSDGAALEFLDCSRRHGPPSAISSSTAASPPTPASTRTASCSSPSAVAASACSPTRARSTSLPCAAFASPPPLPRAWSPPTTQPSRYAISAANCARSPSCAAHCAAPACYSPTISTPASPPSCAATPAAGSSRSPLPSSSPSSTSTASPPPWSSKSISTLP